MRERSLRARSVKSIREKRLSGAREKTHRTWRARETSSLAAARVPDLDGAIYGRQSNVKELEIKRVPSELSRSVTLPYTVTPLGRHFSRNSRYVTMRRCLTDGTELWATLRRLSRATTSAPFEPIGADIGSVPRKMARPATKKKQNIPQTLTLTISGK